MIFETEESRKRAKKEEFMPDKPINVNIEQEEQNALESHLKKQEEEEESINEMVEDAPEIEEHQPAYGTNSLDEDPQYNSDLNQEEDNPVYSSGISYSSEDEEDFGSGDYVSRTMGF